ncbi:MAG: NAD(P)/FAD-dependent oxidoreductase, partial [bacterium]
MRIAIVGGGPAGIFAAITAASGGVSATVEVLEATQQPLDKVLL